MGKINTDSINLCLNTKILIIKMVFLGVVNQDKAPSFRPFLKNLGM